MRVAAGGKTILHFIVPIPHGIVQGGKQAERILQLYDCETAASA